LQVVLEGGLDMSGLPETLKEDLKQLEQVEGQYRVTRCLTEDLEDLSSEEGSPPCGFCNGKNLAEYWTQMMENYKTMITLSKVIPSD
jgi:hypothetical protein